MKFEDTICYKITECTKEVEHAVRTKQFNARKIAQMLVSIRDDAIDMERALKANKVLRLKHNIDPEYRQMMAEKTTTAAINKIGDVNERVDNTKIDAPRFELILKDEKGEVLYHNKKLFAFLVSAVERIEDVDKNGVIDGTTQVFSVGHDLAIWYAYDQFRQKFAAKFAELMVKTQNTIQSGQFANREMRRKFLRGANGKRIL